MISQKIKGNYELTARLVSQESEPKVRIRITGTPNNIGVFLDIDIQGFRVVRQKGRESTLLKDYQRVNPAPWTVWILKKGNFFRFQVNSYVGWIRGPSGEWEGIYEPMEGLLTFDPSSRVIITSLQISKLPWLSQISDPVIGLGPRGSHYEKQIIPGAIIETGNRFYMYCMAGREGDQEGASRRSVAVAVSDDLLSWDVHPKPVLSWRDVPGDNIYVNGAVVTQDGHNIIMYSLQQYPDWKGFMIAKADNPFGPFKPIRQNPVYRHFNNAAHEFDLQEIDHPDYSYIMFYAGYTPEINGQWDGGDRGYLLYSNDLLTWDEAEGNPVFRPETNDNWDAIHIRPRSLNRIDDTWYLWYEGCNEWTPPGIPQERKWCDSVGLARSKDLKNWTYYPRNPALPALGIDSNQFDNTWTGWPRMVVKDKTGYIFYTGNGQVGLRTIPIELLTEWHTEGGETLHII
tara:strand:+ start:99761 stop:101134 length:1374 start_codon:yes stop_codon:yes gene_type:complete